MLFCWIFLNLRAHIHLLRVPERKVLRSTFKHNREEITRAWIKLCIAKSFTTNSVHKSRSLLVGKACNVNFCLNKIRLNWFFCTGHIIYSLWDRKWLIMSNKDNFSYKMFNKGLVYDKCSILFIVRPANMWKYGLWSFFIRHWIHRFIDMLVFYHWVTNTIIRMQICCDNRWHRSFYDLNHFFSTFPYSQRGTKAVTLSCLSLIAF